MPGDYPKFTFFDVLRWKFLPSRFGGGDQYLWSFKRAWIRHNKAHIIEAASRSQIPAYLLAGVAMTEVGGKDFTDWPVFIVRSFDWSGPAWVDNNLTIFANPDRTSMGAVSIQLRRAAETMGIDVSALTQDQLNTLAVSLQSDQRNLDIVARHLKQLILVDFPGLHNATALSDEQVRMAGTRYWYGPDTSRERLQREALKSSSYGSRILQRRTILLELLR